MANLKNITELPVVESADGLNLIVNDNGSAKQIAASAVGAQADWSVTDETNPAFIKNKPLYNDKIWEVIHEEQEIVFDYNSSVEYGFTSGTLTAYPHILSGDYPEGTECKVVIDDEEYIATINKSPNGDNYIGNVALVEGWASHNTRENFFVGYWGVDQILIVTNKPARIYKVSISVLKGEENKLDPKYLSDVVQADWNQNDKTAPDYVKNRPFYEGKTEIPILENAELTLQFAEMGDVMYSYGDPITFSVDHEYRVVTHSQYGDVELFAYPESETVCYFKKGYSSGLVDAITITPNYVNTHGKFFDTMSLYKIVEEVHKLDPKFLPDSVANPKPLILDANLSDYYGGHAEAGDEALEAIKTGRQILVRVPNADGGTDTAIYCPIMMYQVPQNGQYLYMFYLRDEKQDLSSALGLPAGTVVLPTYGEFMMLLSKRYDSNPLEQI